MNTILAESQVKHNVKEKINDRFNPLQERGLKIDVQLWLFAG